MHREQAVLEPVPAAVLPGLPYRTPSDGSSRAGMGGIEGSSVDGAFPRVSAVAEVIPAAEVMAVAWQ